MPVFLCLATVRSLGMRTRRVLVLCMLNVASNQKWHCSIATILLFSSFPLPPLLWLHTWKWAQYRHPRNSTKVIEVCEFPRALPWCCNITSGSDVMVLWATTSPCPTPCSRGCQEMAGNCRYDEFDRECSAVPSHHHKPLSNYRPIGFVLWGDWANCHTLFVTK